MIQFSHRISPISLPKDAVSDQIRYPQEHDTYRPPAIYEFIHRHYPCPDYAGKQHGSGNQRVTCHHRFTQAFGPIFLHSFMNFPVKTPGPIYSSNDPFFGLIGAVAYVVSSFVIRFHFYLGTFRDGPNEQSFASSTFHELLIFQLHHHSVRLSPASTLVHPHRFRIEPDVFQQAMQRSICHQISLFNLDLRDLATRQLFLQRLLHRIENIRQILFGPDRRQFPGRWLVFRLRQGFHELSKLPPAIQLRIQHHSLLFSSVRSTTGFALSRT